jgi:hypothetical protein
MSQRTVGTDVTRTSPMKRTKIAAYFEISVKHDEELETDAAT